MASVVAGTQTQYETEGRAIHKDSVEQRTFVYHGAYGTLKSAMPVKGAVWSAPAGVSGTWYVISSSLERGEDGVMGTLSVTCTDSSLSAPSGSVAALFEQIEIDFAEVTQPIEFHPDFLDLVQESAETATMKAWLKFKASPLSLRLEKKYLDNPDDADSAVKNLPNTIKDWADLYNRGIESYITHLPVVTRIREYRDQPYGVGADLDTKESPPSSGVSVPDGYGEWLKTCDKAIYTSTTGRWQRTEQWTCAAEWPSLLYGGSAS